ncbi:MAG: dockerin type I domain-containing protein [Candidatus Marinimicrobia bacterium]|jgi:hypothetical protein|nr:dockerin type I domain-containing protein [Candidatus Neomarinimicrobiota bacterium]
MKKIKLLFPLAVLYTGLFAVINTFEDSFTRKNNIDIPFQSITMQGVDVDALIREDKENLGNGIPKRYATSFDVDLGIDNSGTWEVMDDGSKIWRLGIYSQGAFGMKVLFDAYLLPEEAELYVFSKNEDMSIGPYTHKQNHADGTFGIPLVKSDHIVVEYYQPANIKVTPQININKVLHAYIDIHGFYDITEDRNCGENVACSSTFDDQENSVIFLDMGGYICSAALINNTSQDLTPYVLTAYHCVQGENPNYFTFYFDHQTSGCSGNSGYYGRSISGSDLKASRNMNSSDVALLEMDDIPPSWWDAYYAGWRRNTSSPTISAGIHHPGGDPMKINYDNDQAYSCSWYGSSTHWCLSWDEGGTEGGSSGSPIFDNNKRIVGQLTGGSGSCGSGGTDYYGKFSTSWNSSGSSSSSLEYWLDPNNTNQYTLDGTYDGASIVYGCTDSGACNYEPDATNNDGSCEYAQGSCNCNGNPTGNYCDCNYNIEDECGVCDGDGSSCAGSVTLSFSSIDGSAGTAEVHMQNDVPIAGFQFVINDSPNYLDLISISEGSSADYGFTVSSSESGTIVGFTLTGTNIPAGSQALLVATFENNNDNQTFDLCLSDPVFSDQNANGVSVTLDSCVDMYFSSSLPGDLNDDGLVNVLDVVVLVNIVLGLGEANPAGDLNGDGLINVLDVVILVNMILGG